MAIIDESHTSKEYRKMRCGYCAEGMKLQQLVDIYGMEWAHVDNEGGMYPCAAADEAIEDLRSDAAEIRNQQAHEEMLRLETELRIRRDIREAWRYSEGRKSLSTRLCMQHEKQIYDSVSGVRHFACDDGELCKT